MTATRAGLPVARSGHRMTNADSRNSGAESHSQITDGIVIKRTDAYAP